MPRASLTSPEDPGKPKPSHIPSHTQGSRTQDTSHSRGSWLLQPESSKQPVDGSNPSGGVSVGGLIIQPRSLAGTGFRAVRLCRVILTCQRSRNGMFCSAAASCGPSARGAAEAAGRSGISGVGPGSMSPLTPASQANLGPAGASRHQFPCHRRGRCACRCCPAGTALEPDPRHFSQPPCCRQESAGQRAGQIRGVRMMLLDVTGAAGEAKRAGRPERLFLSLSALPPL
jgi:hypothetical protein